MSPRMLATPDRWRQPLRRWRVSLPHSSRSHGTLVHSSDMKKLAAALWLPLALLACDRGAADAPSKDPDKTATSAKSNPGAAASSALKQVEAAASAAADTMPAAGGGSDCGTGVRRDQSAKSKGFKGVPGNQANPEVPKRDDFMKACGTLPKDVQQCMKLSHADEECVRVQREGRRPTRGRQGQGQGADEPEQGQVRTGAAAHTLS